ncbi:MAG: hypothetical protein IJR70_02240 [Eubacterium sp.]|nr:hypothetical protein [Eubacterium sp.]
MASIFETLMLISFGLSWPFNLVKNIKAKTAKTMSLRFLLLIEFGYICGIAAKFISGNINYVLIAYFLNLAVVGANIAVYFINKKMDRKNSVN